MGIRLGEVSICVSVYHSNLVLVLFKRISYLSLLAAKHNIEGVFNRRSRGIHQFSDTAHG